MRDRPHLHFRDNTFGTPEEDAFRRDFTVNALFYDIATFSIIDYTGGLEDVRARVIRCIGNPDVRFEEDPVRMLRAIVLAARLDFIVDPPVVDAIRRHAGLIAKASPARLLEEFYKILRSGASERAFHQLAEVGLLEHLAPELIRDRGQALWPYAAALDAYRHRFEAIPESLTNAVLLGTLLVPQGFTAARRPRQFEDGEEPEREPLVTLGRMQLPRRDVERLRQILSLQRRLTDLEASPRAKRAVMHRGPFQEALDVARDSRTGARRARALEGLLRRHGRPAGRTGRRTAGAAPPPASAGTTTRTSAATLTSYEEYVSCATRIHS